MPAKQSGFQGKSVTFVTSIPIPEAPMGRGWADIYTYRNTRDADAEPTGVIRIFPAVPASWQDISFQDLRAMGAFLVSAEQKGGKVQQISIYPEQGGTCRIALPASMQSGEPTVTGNKGDVTREGEVLVIPTQKGERVVISWP